MQRLHFPSCTELLCLLLLCLCGAFYWNNSFHRVADHDTNIRLNHLCGVYMQIMSTSVPEISRYLQWLNEQQNVFGNEHVVKTFRWVTYLHVSCSTEPGQGSFCRFGSSHTFVLHIWNNRRGLFPGLGRLREPVTFQLRKQPAFKCLLWSRVLFCIQF